MTVRVFVNERPVEVERGATVVDAVRMLDPALGERVAAGQARITDGRGIEVGATDPVVAGSIFRVISGGRTAQAASPDADA
jgi:hypothetical protein